MRDPQIEAAARLAADGFQSAGKVNAYRCRGATAFYPAGQSGGCGQLTVTIDRETGVTPFIIKCEHCGGEANSCCYRVPAGLIPTHEWYRPDSLDGQPPHARKHVLKGGLLLRAIAKPDPMETKAVPLGRETVVERSDPPPLGPVTLELPTGPAICHDALSCTMITAERPQLGDRFIVIIAAADIDGQRLGTLAQFTPAEARSFAASLIGAADECDGGQKGAH